MAEETKDNNTVNRTSSGTALNNLPDGMKPVTDAEPEGGESTDNVEDRTSSNENEEETGNASEQETSQNNNEQTTQNNSEETNEEKTEDKTSETENETTSENTEESDTSSENTQGETTTEQETSTPDIESRVKELTGGKYKDIDGLYKELQEKEQKLEEVQNKNLVGSIDELNDRIQNELSDKGIRDISEFQRIRSMDVDNMDGYSKIAEHLRMKDPDITQKEVEFEIGDYKEILDKSNEEIKQEIEEGNLTQKEVDRVQTKFERAKREADRDLKQRKGELDNIAETSRTESKQEPQISKEEAERMAREDAHSVKEQKVTVGEQEVTLQLTEDKVSNIEKALVDGSYLNKRWSNEDGSINREQLAKDFALLEASSDLFKGIYDNAFALGKKNAISNIDNKDHNEKAPSNKGGDKKETPSQKAARQAFSSAF